jgi:hypothetical protein
MINRTLLIALIVAIAGAVAYFVFFREPAGPALEEVQETRLSASMQADRELLILLEKLEAIRLDKDFFTTPLFRSLQDFRVEPPREPLGRPNPFSPIGTN